MVSETQEEGSWWSLSPALGLPVALSSLFHSSSLTSLELPCLSVPHQSETLLDHQISLLPQGFV